MWLLALLFVSGPGCFLAPGVALGQGAAAPAADAAMPKTPVEWYRRADEQMNIRMPGGAPFHMKVAFEAFPGEEMLAKGDKPEIAAGKGEYEETWVAPHQWRREVRLGEYHAVEVESAAGRKMQASLDYEPGRVLLLLANLLSPIRRDLLESAAAANHRSSKAVSVVTSGGISLVRVEHPQAAIPVNLNNADFFTLKGILISKSDGGLRTTLTNDRVFAGKLVPGQIEITAPGLTPAAPDRPLLTADVQIEPAQGTGSDLFVMAGNTATPGQTLRPLSGFAASPGPLGYPPGLDSFLSSALVLNTVLDRTGRHREVELIAAFSMKPKDTQRALQAFRNWRWQPAKIDGDPCELLESIAQGQQVQGADR